MFLNSQTTLSVPRQRIGKVIVENGKPVGVAVAVSKGETSFSVGFSVLHESDKFNRALGIKIALGRAESGSNAKIHPARTEVRKSIEGFRHRAARYFQSKSELPTGRR